MTATAEVSELKLQEQVSDLAYRLAACQEVAAENMARAADAEKQLRVLAEDLDVAVARADKAERKLGQVYAGLDRITELMHRLHARVWSEHVT